MIQRMIVLTLRVRRMVGQRRLVNVSRKCEDEIRDDSENDHADIESEMDGGAEEVGECE